MDRLLTLIVGLIGGLAVGVQSPIAGGMSNRIGGAAGSLIVHVSGAVLSLALLLLRGGENIAAWTTLPWYMLASGASGLVLYLTLNHTLPNLGAAGASTLIIVGQLFAVLVIDHFGWLGVPQRPADLTRLAAAGLLLLGAWLMVR